MVSDYWVHAKRGDVCGVSFTQCFDFNTAFKLLKQNMVQPKELLDEISLDKIKKEKLDGICYQAVRRRLGIHSVFHSTSFFIAKNFFLTSAHNVRKASWSGNVKKITISPSRIGNEFPRGSIIIDVDFFRNIRIAPQYSLKRKTYIPHDIALIYVPDSIIDANASFYSIPYLPIIDDISSINEGDLVYCAGYPASGKYKGQYKMTLDTSRISKINDNSFKHDLDTRTGNSGSPIMVKREGQFYVIGINSIKHNGTLLNDEKRDLINKWMKELKGQFNN